MSPQVIGCVPPELTGEIEDWYKRYQLPYKLRYLPGEVDPEVLKVWNKQVRCAQKRISLLTDPRNDSLRAKFNERSFNLLVAAFPKALFGVDWNNKLPNIEPDLLRQNLAKKFDSDLAVSSPDQFYLRDYQGGSKRLIQHPRKTKGLAPGSISIFLDYYGLSMPRVPTPEEVARHHGFSLGGVQQSVQASRANIRRDVLVKSFVGLST